MKFLRIANLIKNVNIGMNERKKENVIARRNDEAIICLFLSSLRTEGLG